MRELITIDVMKNMKDFDVLSNYILKISNKFRLKGDVKFKSDRLEFLDCEIEFEDDITKFTLEGKGILETKTLFGKNTTVVNFFLDNKNKTFETNCKEREKERLLRLLILGYFDLIKKYAIQCKEQCKGEKK